MLCVDDRRQCRCSRHAIYHEKRRRPESRGGSLGFRTLTCGCVIGRYRDLASGRELTYVEKKGSTCESHAHRRNHTVAADREHVPAVA